MGIGAVASAVAIAGDICCQPGSCFLVVAEHVLQFGCYVSQRVFGCLYAHLRLTEFFRISQILADIVRGYIHLLQSVECGVCLLCARIILDGTLEGAYSLVVLLEVAMNHTLLQRSLASHVRIGVVAQQAFVCHDGGLLLVVLDISARHFVESIIGVVGLWISSHEVEHLFGLVDVLVHQSVSVTCLERGVVCTGSV